MMTSGQNPGAKQGTAQYGICHCATEGEPFRWRRRLEGDQIALRHPSKSRVRDRVDRFVDRNPAGKQTAKLQSPA